MTAAQVHFVSLEVCALLAYLQAQLVLFRDLKLSNLLLDREGHIRLIDFGTAKTASDGKTAPTSREFFGSFPYVTPEVSVMDNRKAYNRERALTAPPYDSACDLFSFGVLLYELSENAYPFGWLPKYREWKQEWTPPKLLDERGDVVPHFSELLHGLLQWKPHLRLGSAPCGGIAALKQAAYFGAADWEMVEAGRTPSPLREHAQSRINTAMCKSLEGSMRKRSVELEQQVAAFERAQQASMKVDALLEKREMDVQLSWQEEALIRDEREKLIDGWEFVSQHALVEDYVSKHASTMQLWQKTVGRLSSVIKAARRVSFAAEQDLIQSLLTRDGSAAASIVHRDADGRRSLAQGSATATVDGCDPGDGMADERGLNGPGKQTYYGVV